MLPSLTRVRRLSLWMRAHPVFGDSLVAACLALPDLLFVTGEGLGGYVLSAVLLLAPLVYRRRRPLLVAYAVLPGGCCSSPVTRPRCGRRTSRWA